MLRATARLVPSGLWLSPQDGGGQLRILMDSRSWGGLGMQPEWRGAPKARRPWRSGASLGVGLAECERSAVADSSVGGDWSDRQRQMGRLYRPSPSVAVSSSLLVCSFLDRSSLCNSN